MASGGISAQNDPSYASAITELHPHATSLFQPPSSHSTLPSSASGLSVTSDPPLLDSLSVLSAGTSGESPIVGGGARDNAMTLSHVLSGLQEEGALAEVLQEQPHLADGKLFVWSSNNSFPFMVIE